MWHIIELDFFFEELVHLSFNWVFCARLHKRRCVVDHGHAVEIFVLARVHTAIPKVIIKQILSMSSIGHPIVNQQLKNDFQSSFTMEGQIFTIACHNLAILLESLLHIGSI